MVRESIEDLLDSGNRPLEVICEFRFLDLEDAKAIGKLVVDERDNVSFTIYRDVIHSAREKGLHPIVHATSNTSKITLLNCIKGGCGYQKDFPYEEYNCSSMVVGCHLEQANLEQIISYQFTFDELAKWLNVVFFDSDHEGDESRYTFGSTKTYVDTVDCTDEIVKISVTTGSSFPTRGATQLRTIKVPWFESILKKPVPVNRIHRHLLRWHDLFTFISFHEITWGAVYLGYEGCDEKYRWISRRYRRKERERSIHAFDLLFNYEDRVNEPSKIFKGWVRAYERNRSGIRLFCSALSGKNYYEHNYLSLIQTLESYQYYSVSRQLVSDDTYKPIMDGIFASLDASIPEQVRKSIEDKVKYANRTTLLNLLIAVYDSVSEYFPDTYCERTEVVKRLKRVKDSRNNFVHRGRLTPSAKKDKYDDMFEDGELLKYIVFATVAKEIGVNAKSITETISRMMHNYSVSTVLVS